MDERIEQDITETMDAAERLQTAKEWMASGINAAAFVRGVLGMNFSFDEGVQLYGMHIEAIASGNHYHGESEA